MCSAHFKPSDVYQTITGNTRLKAGVLPSLLAWTKDSKEYPQNQLQELRNIAEQQAKEERRQSLFDSVRQDVEMEEEVTESAGQVTAETMQEMATNERENENIQPAELSPERTNWNT